MVGGNALAVLQHDGLHLMLPLFVAAQFYVVNATLKANLAAKGDDGFTHFFYHADQSESAYVRVANV